MAPKIDYNNKSLALISGAARGIGRSIAISLAKRLHPNSHFVLLDINEQGLKNSTEEILKINNKFTVQYFITDFRKPDLALYESILDKVITSVDKSDLQYAFCFHDAATSGQVNRASTLTDLAIWRSYFDLNLHSMVLLNSAFLSKLGPIANQLVIVNMSSIAGTDPYQSLAMYSAGKASRAIYFKILALEEPNCLVLNYTPGAVDTDMFATVMNTAESEDLRNLFKKIKVSDILQPDETVRRLLDLLENGSFKTGDTIDYADSIE